jgi:hypothetical protein
MADPTKEDLAARQKADADAKVRATAPTPPPPAPVQPAEAAHTDAMTTLAAAVKDIQQRMSPAAASIPTADLDKTQPGGFYIVNGVNVNSHGRELNDDGSLKHPEQQRVNEFGQLV